MRDEIIDRSDSRELNDVCQGPAQWRSVRLRRSVGRIVQPLPTMSRPTPSAIMVGIAMANFGQILDRAPLICALLHQFVRFLSQVLFPGNARTLAVSTGFDPGLDM